MFEVASSEEEAELQRAQAGNKEAAGRLKETPVGKIRVLPSSFAENLFTVD